MTTEKTQPSQPSKPQRPMIILQIHLPPNASQPIGIPIDISDWETALDNTILQIKLAVMRWQIASLRATTPVETQAAETAT